jgi:hypothetical protein
MSKRRHHRKHRRGHHGVGTSITLKGIGRAKKMRGPGAVMMFVLPAVVGGGITALGIVAARYFTMPKAGEAFSDTTRSVFKNAPWIGLLAGGVSTVATYMLMGPAAAAGAGVGSLMTALTAFGNDKIIAMDPNSLAQSAIALLPSQPAATTQPNGISGLGTIYTMRKTGAVVPQLKQNMGAIVAEPTHGLGNLGYKAYTGGETVSLSGVSPAAFGTPQT